MPVIKSAIKKLRKDRKREKVNDVFREAMDKAIKAAKKTPTQKTASLAFSVIDKAVKNHLLHKNKAARMKSGITKLLPKKAGAKTAEKESIKTEKKVKTVNKKIEKPKTAKKAAK